MNLKAQMMKLKGILSTNCIFAEEFYHFEIKINFSTVGSLLGIKSKFIGSPISFLPDDSVRNFLGFDAVTLYEEYDLSPTPVDIISFDIFLHETNIAQGKNFRGRN